MNILFLTRSLGVGGAERQLVTLACALHNAGHRVTVSCLYDIEGPLKEQLRKNSISFHVFKKKGRWDLVRFFFSLVCFVRSLKPDIVHSYMPLQNILALSLKPFVFSKIVCGIRIALPNLKAYDRLTQVVYWLEKKIIGFSDGVISNSQAALARYQTHQKKTVFHVIPNGVDFSKFYPSFETALSFRAQNHLPQQDFLIGMVGRFDPQKNYPLFLKAAARLLRQRKDLHFVGVGDQTGPYFPEYVKQARELGLENKITWLYKPSEMRELYSALDLLCLTSDFEGFPNVLVEALACGTPCLSTDAGDAAVILKSPDLGTVVPTGDLEALVQGLHNSLPSKRKNRSYQEDMAQKRQDSVQNRFSVDALRIRTEQALESILHG